MKNKFTVKTAFFLRITLQLNLVSPMAKILVLGSCI